MTYQDFGIDVEIRANGSKDTICPKCSHTRKKSTQKCLHVDFEKQVWRCNHCEWAGGLPKEKQIIYEVPEWKNNTNLSDGVLKWFESRRISAETCLKLKITHQDEYIPQINKITSVIAFNYFFQNEIVNIKYRDGAKNFKLFKGAELIPYNLDSVINQDEVWIVEGEMDCLSLVEAGIESVISVPNGAGNNTNYLDRFMPIFDSVKKVHICTDNDTKGRELKELLANRFGKHKCDYIIFDGCKDANEYLILNGKIQLREAAYKFIDFPLEGIFSCEDYIDEVFDLYTNGFPDGASIGYWEFDQHLKFHKGYLTTITGIPGHGKSDFLDQILVNLLLRFNWKGGFYSPENRPVQLHISKLCKKIIGKSWGGEGKMDSQEIINAMNVMFEKFFFIKPKENFTLDSILDHVLTLINRKGIDFFVIDAWNKLEHLDGASETKYIGQCLDKIVNFCERHNVHCFLVAHPTKIRKQKDSNIYEVPNLYDIAGSANFFNKTDNGLTIYRDMENDLVEVHIQKVKFSHWGKIGMVKFMYNKTTGQYIAQN